MHEVRVEKLKLIDNHRLFLLYSGFKLCFMMNDWKPENTRWWRRTSDFNYRSKLRSSLNYLFFVAVYRHVFLNSNSTWPNVSRITIRHNDDWNVWSLFASVEFLAGHCAHFSLPWLACWDILLIIEAAESQFAFRARVIQVFSSRQPPINLFILPTTVHAEIWHYRDALIFKKAKTGSKSF